MNLKGLILVANALLPLLRRQQKSRLVNVGSGLGNVPLVAAPVYSATKAAVHSFTISLRRQLAGSSVQVVELINPLARREGRISGGPWRQGLTPFDESPTFAHAPAHLPAPGFCFLMQRNRSF